MNEPFSSSSAEPPVPPEDSPLHDRPPADLAALLALPGRDFLDDLPASGWRPAVAPTGPGWLRLRPVERIGRPKPEGWTEAAAAALAACHEPGQAFAFAIGGKGGLCRLFFGGARVPETAGHDVLDYLDRQGSVLESFLPGLRLGAPPEDGLGELAAFIRAAPAVAAVTGIPSERTLAPDAAGLDRFALAVGEHEYLLLILAEPLPPAILGDALAAGRRLRAAVQAVPHFTLTETVRRNDDTNRRVRELTQTDSGDMNSLLMRYGQATGLSVGSLLLGMFGSKVNETERREASAEHAVEGTSGRHAEHVARREHRDPAATDAEHLLGDQAERLRRLRNGGAWRAGALVAAASPAACRAVVAALRGLFLRDPPILEPARVVIGRDPAWAHAIRSAMLHGRIVGLEQGGTAKDVPGPTAALASLLTTAELTTLVNLPRGEVPGVPSISLAPFGRYAPAAADPAVDLGRLHDDVGRDLGPVRLPLSALNKHAFVTGTTGFGKTNTCMRLLLEAHARGIPFLVIEPVKTEYRRLAQVKELDGKLRVYSVGGSSPLPFRLNPFEPVWNPSEGRYLSVSRHVEMLKSVFNASFSSMMHGMPYVLEEALQSVYRKRGWVLQTSTNRELELGKPRKSEGPDGLGTLESRWALLPSLQDLYLEIEPTLQRKGYAQEVHQNISAALRARIESLMKGTKGEMLNTRRSIPLAALFEEPTLIELDDLGDDDDKAFVMALLFVLLYQYARVRARGRLDKRDKLQHLTLVEEAHRLLKAAGPVMPEVGNPQGKAVGMFIDMLAEMRAQGEGFLIADQIPTKVTPEVLKNTNLKIVHRLMAPDEREVAGRCIGLNGEQIEALNHLEPGQAVVHDERIKNAVLVMVADVKDRVAGELRDAELDSLLRRQAPKVPPEYVRRHAGCSRCPAPCTFLPSLEEVSDPRSVHRVMEEMRPVLDALLLDADPGPAWAAWVGWRGRWQTREPALRGTKPAEAVGLTYCAAVQLCARWAWELLIDRVAGEPRTVPAVQAPGGRPPGPPGASPSLAGGEYLRLERAAGAVAPLWWAWAQRDQLDEEARKAYQEARDRLLDALGARAPWPGREWDGCAGCPCRCLYAGLIGGIDLATAGDCLRTPLSTALSPAQRVEAMVRDLQPISRAMPARVRDGGLARRDWLYCLLTHLRFPGEAGRNRDEVLAWLREEPRGGVISPELLALGVTEPGAPAAGPPSPTPPSPTPSSPRMPPPRPPAKDRPEANLGG